MIVKSMYILAGKIDRHNSNLSNKINRNKLRNKLVNLTKLIKGLLHYVKILLKQEKKTSSFIITNHKRQMLCNERLVWGDFIVRNFFFWFIKNIVK